MLHKIVIFSIFLIFFSTSRAEEKLFKVECGKTKFEILKISKEHPSDNQFVLYANNSGKRKKLYISNEGGWFFSSCVDNENGESFFLFQAFCGGSACVENKYGIINSRNLDVLLLPGKKNVGNSKEASKILGRDVPYLVNSKEALCCE